MSEGQSKLLVSGKQQNQIRNNYSTQPANQHTNIPKKRKTQSEKNQQKHAQILPSTINFADLMSSKSDGNRTQSKISETFYQQIIPLSHEKREKSLSPIKSQNSIVFQQNHSVTFKRRDTNQSIQLYSIKNQYSSNQKSEHIFLSKSSQPQIIQQQKSLIQSLVQKTLQPKQQQTKQQLKSPIKSPSLKSSRKSEVRRTQIFSSDKKHIEKNLQLNTNIIAEQILNLNLQQRTSRHQFYKELQKQKDKKSTPFKKGRRQEESKSLSRSKSKQIKKLQVISSSPFKATQEYLHGIYPQSRRYISTLKNTLFEQKQIIKKWQSDIQLGLRQNIYQVEEILLQKLYEISRQCVKLWVHEQLQKIQKLWNEDFSFVKEAQLDIKQNELKLQEYENLLQELNLDFKSSQQKRKALSFFQKGIIPAQLSKSIGDNSQKVKQVVTKSEELATKICQQKIQKAKKIDDFQSIRDQDRLDKIIQNLLKHLFTQQEENNSGKIKKNNVEKKGPKRQGFDIGDKIKRILNKSEEKEPQTTRQQVTRQFQYSDKYVPYSHRKSHHTPSVIIKNNQKQFNQFKDQFQRRKQNFIQTTSNTFQPQQKRKKPLYQQPISLKSAHKQKSTFDEKLTNLFKKITEPKYQQPQYTNRSSINTNYYNDYNDVMKKKKQQNRQHFFRNSIQ